MSSIFRPRGVDFDHVDRKIYLEWYTICAPEVA